MSLKEAIMPEAIIKNFQKEYGAKKGKRIYYATANKQGRNPETFKQETATKPKKAKKQGKG